MQYYISQAKSHIDFDNLRRMIRDGLVYSLSVREAKPRGYQCIAELLIPGRGLTEFHVGNAGLLFWEDETSLNQVVLEALKARPPQEIDRHLLNKQKDGLLCGAPLKWKGRQFTTVAPERLLLRPPEENGPHCERCRLNAIALGWIESDEL